MLYAFVNGASITGVSRREVVGEATMRAWGYQADDAYWESGLGWGQHRQVIPRMKGLVAVQGWAMSSGTGSASMVLRHAGWPLMACARLPASHCLVARKRTSRGRFCSGHLPDRYPVGVTGGVEP